MRTRPNWRNEARTAIAALKGVSHGLRGAEMQNIAGRIGGHRDTSAMRRAIAAENFLAELQKSDPAVYSLLEAAPLSVVEVIGRWSAFDPPAAHAAAEQWATGVGNVTSITDAMRAARPSGYAGKTGIALEKAYVVAAKTIVAETVSELTSHPMTLLGTSVREPATGQTLDFVFEVAKDKDLKRQVGVLIVGPYSNSRLYANRCSDWVARAFGLALLIDRIVLALPEAAALAEYAGRVAAVGERLRARKAASGAEIAQPVVDVVHINVPKLSEEEFEELAALSGLQP